jgi:hypothetical protein
MHLNVSIELRAIITNENHPVGHNARLNSNIAICLVASTQSGCHGIIDPITLSPAAPHNANFKASNS